MKKYLVLGALAASLIFSQAQADQVKSVRVVDSDTIVVNRSKIRLVGIDGPEIMTRLLNKSTCPEQEKALGLRAKARTSELVDMSQHRVTVKFHKGHDVWGRNLADVYSDGKSVATTLVNEGLAMPWPDMKAPRPVFCLVTAIKKNMHRRAH